MTEMWHDLKIFLSERCPLTVVLPLAAVLYGAAAMMGRPLRAGFIVGLATTCIGLVVLRMADDLADLPLDRIRHPQRGLVRGRIQPAGLKKAVALGIIALVVLNFFQPNLVFVGILLGWYLVFFAVKNRLSIAFHPWGVNAVFFMIPLYAGGTRSPLLCMALFVGLAVVGHDWVHSVHAADEGCAGVATPSSHWGAARAALVGLACYAAALAAGICFWWLAGRPLLFLLCLAVTTAWLSVLALRLLRRPGAERARAFYVPGFLFFVLPLAALILDRIIIG